MAEIRKLPKKNKPLELNIKRVAAYVRVSKENDRLLHSIKAQKEYYSKLLGDNPMMEFIGIYSDSGITGVNTKKRDEFNKMIEDALEGKIDVIYVKSVSRFARNTVDTLQYTRQLKAVGVEVYFEKENISSLSEEGELMLTLLASVAQAEAESTSQNVKWSRQKSFEQGDPQTRTRLFGYEWIDDVLTVVPAEAFIVKKIYEMYLNNKSTVYISKWLNEIGCKTIRGATFDAQAVIYILRNITYTGNMLLGKTRTVNPLTKKRERNYNLEFESYYTRDSHEAIIDMATYQLVQEKLEEHNIARQNGKMRYTDTNVFYHKIKCGFCGYYYSYCHKKEPAFYCSWRQAKRERCENTQIIESTLKQRLCDTFGWDEFTEELFNQTVDQIVVRHGEPLEVHLTSGETIEIQWKWRKKYAYSNKATS